MNKLLSHFHCCCGKGEEEPPPALPPIEEPIQIFYLADCYNVYRVPEAITLYNQQKNGKSIVVGGGDWFGSGALSKYYSK